MMNVSAETISEAIMVIVCRRGLFWRLLNFSVFFFFVFFEKAELACPLCLWLWRSG